MPGQKILTVEDDYAQMDQYLRDIHAKKIMLVCGGSIKLLEINNYFDTLAQRLGIKVIRFTNFEPNPKYESVVEGVSVFCKENCDAIVAVGGGSAIDVAKCIKLYAFLDPKINYIKQTIVPNKIKLAVVPTTAGTGSEATKFAVIYYKGEKQSISHESVIPDMAMLDAAVLKSLPLYQKKSTMMDAMCHALESYWSIHSTETSREYSRTAIKMILDYRCAYLENTKEGNTNMLKAANIAGHAINITQTTAGHAMCYKITSLYGIAHGHAAALCVEKLWPYMLIHKNECQDERGTQYIEKMFEELAGVMGCKTPEDAAQKFAGMVDVLDLNRPKLRSEEEFERLRVSVNRIRLKNNPIRLNQESIDILYRQILS